MQHLANKKDLLHEIRRLQVVDRLNLVIEIWDEIKESEALESVSEDEKKLLLTRLSHYKTSPESATDWIDLRKEMYDKYAD